MDSERQLVEESSSRIDSYIHWIRRKEEENNDIRYSKLYKAIISADWTTAQKIFDKDPDALTARISEKGYTALHIAVAAVASRRNISFVKKLLDLMDKNGKSLGVQGKGGYTALHCAAMAGNTKAAQMLVEKDSRLAREKNTDGATPLVVAADRGHEETVRYLLRVARNNDHDQNSFIREEGASFLILLVLDGFYDMAISVLEEHAELAVETTGLTTTGNSALSVLAATPQAFSSGNQLRFWQLLSYYVVSGTRIFVDRLRNAFSGADVENPIDKWKTVLKECCLFGFLKDVHHTELRHKLLKSLIEKAMNSTASKARKILFDSSLTAAQLGNHEFVKEVIEAYPALVLAVSPDTSQGIFDVAVKNRQEEVFNLLFQTGLQKHFIMHPDERRNSIWHHAALLHSSAQIDKIPGAALQMQREFQWFKEVEKLVPQSFAVALNDEKKTPAMLFAESHKDLAKEGEKWMKETADSYAIVAALIVTIAFASAFTLPGENIPISIYETSFMVFTISNSVALFSSVTSLLMFLGILTSRYKQEDFFKPLPTRFVIGLITLFLAIAAMLVAFSASVYIVLYHRVHWVVAPIGLLVAVLVFLFARLQIPLLFDFVRYRFGPNIVRE